MLMETKSGQTPLVDLKMKQYTLSNKPLMEAIFLEVQQKVLEMELMICI